MARIPIPTVQPGGQATPTASLPYLQVQSTASNAVASSLQQLGSVFQKIGEEDARAWASKNASDDQLKWMQRLDELKGTAQPGAPGFTETVLGEFDAYATKARESAPAHARRFYDTQLNELRNYLGRNAVGWQAQQHRANTVDQYQQGLSADSASVALDPSLYDERRAARLAVLSQSNLPPDVRNDMLARTEGSMAFAAGAATIDRDPRGSMEAFAAASQGSVPTGYEWIGRLGAEQIQQLRTRAQTQSDRMETRARVDYDRAIARAQRAVGEMDKQVSTGVPARGDDMLRWSRMVQGTEYEASFREMMRGQEEVQKVLRMPVDEQATYIQDRRLQQQRSGASTTDIANLDRLSRAVESNAKMLRDSPLAWVEMRSGQRGVPLNFGQLATPEGTAALGQSLRDRSDVIRGLQRANPAGAVQMRPLLPAEAEQLSAAFKQAGAREKRQILGQLFWAAGSPDTYQGIVSQVDGIDPMMARLGRLAGSYEQAKLQNNFFSPDVVQSAGDAAATAIAGDEILRAGGKAGSLSYPLPKDSEFTQAIADKVGKLYRGAGAGDSGGQAFMQDAYAVKAYYVGKAAQEGDLSPDVNSSRLDQAIAAVLGQPVNFHGNGEILAPWGMNESDFLDRANRAVVQEVAARGLQDQMGRSMSNTGLIGVGAGAYAVTLGGLPVRDPKTRQAIIIQMTPDADAGRDEFGQRLSDMIPGTPQ